MSKTKIFLSLTIFILGFLVSVFPSFAQNPPQIFQDLLDKVTATSWPGDIPIFPKATPIVPSVSSDHNPSKMDLEIGSMRVFWLTNQDSPEAAISWYQENLPKNGWTVFSKQEFMQIYETLEIKEFEGIANFFRSLPGAQTQTIDIETIYGKQYLFSWKPEIITKTRTNACRFFSVNSFDVGMAEDNFSPLVLMEITTKTPCPNACEFPPEIEQERQEIKNKIQKSYRFRIGDSNVCGREDICGSNTPWSTDQLIIMDRVLEKLPACFTSNLRLDHVSGLIEVLPEAFPDSVIKDIFNLYKRNCCQGVKPKNYGFYFPITSTVIVCDQIYVGRYGLDYVLVHELTHALQWFNVTMPSVCDHLPCPGGPYTNPLMTSWLKETGWSLDGMCLPFLGCPGATMGIPDDLPTDYAKTGPLDDMAESVALYVTNPQKLLEISPRRYNFVKNKIMCGKEYL